MAGYPDDKANKDIQRVYLLGQLKATQSIHTSYGNSGTLKRIKHLRKQLALNESVKQGRKQSKKGR